MLSGLLLLLVACGQQTAAPAQTGRLAASGSGEASRQPTRTLAIAFRVEPATVALHALRNTGVTDYLTKRLFNASLAQLDNRGVVRPYLASTPPTLNTDSWRLFDDGTMETTYLLDSRGTWHDGRPLTADDFVFSWQVSRIPELGQVDATPMNLMAEVTAPDAHTLVIRWSRIYVDAAHLSTHNFELAALPRHLLEEPQRSGSADGFLSHPFWTRDYVGLGPFRIERWEAGAFIEAAAFDGNVLGRPKVDRVRLVFIGDGNTVLSNMLAGEVHMSGDGALRVEQAITLQREWAPRNGGAVVMQPNQWRAVNFQMREELATPRALMDARTRRALSHATDKQSINEALYGGLERVADFVLPPLSEQGLAAERAATKYPYDLRRTDQIIGELGFAKDSDGFYASPADGRFVAEIKTNAAPDNEKELAVVAAGFRSAGFDVQQAVLPVAQAQDPQIRSTYPGMYVNSTPALESTLVSLTEANIPRAENRWRGSNRGGWANAEYTRLADRFGAALDARERSELVADMARVFSTDLPAVSIVFRSHPWAHVSDLQGPTQVPPETNIGWNLHEWAWVR